MPQRGKVVEREVPPSAPPAPGADVEILLQLAKQLGLLDAVDSQIGFQIGIELDHFGRIARLLDHEVDQKRFQFGRALSGRCRLRTAASFVQPHSGRGDRGRRQPDASCGRSRVVGDGRRAVICSVAIGRTGVAGRGLAAAAGLAAVAKAWLPVLVGPARGRLRGGRNGVGRLGGAGLAAGEPARGRGYTARSRRPVQLADRIFSRRRSVASK